MTFEELFTTLCLIEVYINSRPLSTLSTDPNNLKASTLGHYLIGASLLALRDISSNVNPCISLSSRWKLYKKVRDYFWQRWTKDYFQTLYRRHKWQKGNPIIRTSQLVLVKEPSIHRIQWILAHIDPSIIHISWHISIRPS